MLPIVTVSCFHSITYPGILYICNVQRIPLTAAQLIPTCLVLNFVAFGSIGLGGQDNFVVILLVSNILGLDTRIAARLLTVEWLIDRYVLHQTPPNRSTSGPDLFGFINPNNLSSERR